MNRPSQIPLELPLAAAATRDDLIVTAANAFAVAFLDSWPDWPGPITILRGPTGSGKTHMARAWAAMADAQVVAAGELRDDRPPVTRANVVVEDAGTGAVAETALFHLMNHVRAAGGHCLITTRLAPAEWGVRLPDLASRLRAAQLVELAGPDDDLLARVMVKLFADRQVAVDPGVVDYVVQRMERSLAAAGLLVAEMDREALARSGRVTRAIAAAALARLAVN